MTTIYDSVSQGGLGLKQPVATGTIAGMTPNWQGQYVDNSLGLNPGPMLSDASRAANNSDAQKYDAFYKNPNASFQIQGLTGAPPLTTSFPQTPEGNRTTGILTSKQAQDHSFDMKNTVDQANNDLQNHNAFQAQQSQTNQQNQQAQNQQDIENTQNQQKADATLNDSLGNLFNELTGIQGTVAQPNAMQQDVLENNPQEIALMKQQMQTVSDTLKSMTLGTHPLTAGQQSQVNNLAAQYSKAFEDARKLGDQQVMGQTMLNAQTKLQMYSPQEAMSKIQSIIDNTGNKITQINTKLIDDQNKLTQAIEAEQYKYATQLYNDISNGIKDKTDALSEANKAIEEQQKVFELSKNEGGIIALMKSGINNPVDILQELKKNGFTATFDQVADITDRMKEADKAIPGIVGEWIAATEHDPSLKGVSLMDYIKMKNPQDAQDMEYKALQIAKLRLELQNGGIEGVDTGQLLAYANQYASNGQIPTGLPKGTFGIVAKYAKELPKDKGTIVDRNTGVKSSKTSATLDNAYGSLYSAIDLAKQLRELDDKRIGGVISGSLGKVFGSEDQQRYVDLRAQIVDLLARARTGAAINASEEALYSGMLPGRFSEPFGFGAQSTDRIDNFVNNLSSDLLNKTKTQGLSVYGLSKVTVGGKEYTVGDIISNSKGETGRILPDGSIVIEQ